MQKLRIELESESNIVAVYRFGSSARGHATGVSDIDIGIVADHRLGQVEEYRDTIHLLGQNGHLDPDLT
jgi:predicted nucleotidyltransferase